MIYEFITITVSSLENQNFLFYPDGIFLFMNYIQHAECLGIFHTWRNFAVRIDCIAPHRALLLAVPGLYQYLLSQAYRFEYCSLQSECRNEKEDQYKM